MIGIRLEGIRTIFRNPIKIFSNLLGNEMGMELISIELFTNDQEIGMKCYMYIFAVMFLYKGILKEISQCYFLVISFKLIFGNNTLRIL